MKSRLFALFMLLIMIAVLVPAASAQTDVTCLGLNGDDCAIITAANENTAKIQSFTQAFTFDFSVSGAGAMTGGTDGVSLKANGSGPFVIDAAAADPSAMVSMAMDITGSADAGSDNQSGSISVRIVDGIIYVSDPKTGEWKGAKLADLLSSVTDQMGAMTGGAGGASTSGTGGAAGLASNPAVMGLASAAMAFDPVKIPGFLTQTREADADMMGQKMVAFNYTADIGALLTSPEFQKLMSQATTAATQADPQAAQMAMMVPMLATMATGNFNYTRWVGADDGFIHRIVFAGDINLDLSAMMGASGSSGAQMPPINMKLNLTVDLSEINNTAAPVAPEGATIVPASEIMG
ncbi:MAG: hypothetical protein R3E39_10095 [Anaerolineae bacterium]